MWVKHKIQYTSVWMDIEVIFWKNVSTNQWHPISMNQAIHIQTSPSWYWNKWRATTQTYVSTERATGFSNLIAYTHVDWIWIPSFFHFLFTVLYCLFFLPYFCLFTLVLLLYRFIIDTFVMSLYCFIFIMLQHCFPFVLFWIAFVLFWIASILFHHCIFYVPLHPITFHIGSLATLSAHISSLIVSPSHSLHLLKTEQVETLCV